MRFGSNTDDSPGSALLAARLGDPAQLDRGLALAMGLVLALVSGEGGHADASAANCLECGAWLWSRRVCTGGLPVGGPSMIVILGLIILFVAVIVGVAGVLGNAGGGHELTNEFSVFGYHVTGSTGTLFLYLSLIHISEPTRQAEISYAVFCLKKK